MSLFPAYSGDIKKERSDEKIDINVKDEQSADWLINSSFQIQFPLATAAVDVLSESSTDESIDTVVSSAKDTTHNVDSSSGSKHAHKRRDSRHVKKHRKEKRKRSNYKTKVKDEYEKDVENVYFEDKHRDKRMCTVDTLCSRVRPLYDTGKMSLGFLTYKKLKKENFQRYHIKNIDSLEKILKKDTVIKKETIKDTSNKNENDIPSWCPNLEEEERLKTREFNEKLTQDPHNVSMWIEYAEFQDMLAKFNPQRWLTLDTPRSVLTKKLSIIEKAYEKNPQSIELLKLKLRLTGELTPADQFSNDIEALVNKDSSNIILWKTLVMTIQSSVAMCSVPRVLELYSKCFCVLKQRSRTNPRVFDEILLEMLYQCLIFLRHAGLWEQMWETIRLNLTLNLSLDQNNLSFQGSIDEKKLIGMEEVVLMSRLPLNQLWLRIESLRENCHWISCTREELELVGDSRRFILPNDVADFVHPIVSRNSNFKMAIYSLLALKVPLLPTRDCILKDLNIKEFEWGTETSEMILPFGYPTVGEIVGNNERRELLRGIIKGQLTSGPQYLQFHPAQEPYLEFVRQVFHTIAENLPSQQRTSIYVWWLRFERLLVFFTKNDPLKSDNKGKKLKNILKEFLKKDENRNNVYFYKEYALIEREMDRFDNCVNILETAIQSHSSPSTISDHEEKTAIFNLYRTLIETLLNVDTYKESHKERILNIISRMVPEASESQIQLAENYLQEFVQKFLQEPVTFVETDISFLPNLECDVIVCYAYLLYVKNCDIHKVIDIFNVCIEHSKNNQYLQEILYESEISILQFHYFQTQELYDVLKETVKNALNVYTNNFYMLSVFACMESDLPCWKLNNMSNKVELWQAIAMCLACRKRISFLISNGLTDAVSATVHKLISFHRRFAKIPEIRCCPLLWRMYMLLLREHNLCEQKGEEAYHESIRNCPWVRNVYIDAAEVAPQLLTQIQDLIREKELRMHITPEELDILRG